jgi:hypothetical protein
MLTILYLLKRAIGLVLLVGQGFCKSSPSISH